MNGYDCGVYVQLFAKYVIDEWPSSTLADHKNRYKKKKKEEEKERRNRPIAVLQSI